MILGEGPKGHCRQGRQGAGRGLEGGFSKFGKNSSRASVEVIIKELVIFLNELIATCDTRGDHPMASVRTPFTMLTRCTHMIDIHPKHITTQRVPTRNKEDDDEH